MSLLPFDLTSIQTGKVVPSLFFRNMANEIMWSIPSNTYFVSPYYVLGVGEPYYPDVRTALAAAVAGYNIIVYPGTYQGDNVLKNGVDIFCYPGVTLRNDTTAVAGYAGCVVTDNAQTVSCSVYGYADIIKYESGAVQAEAAAIGIYGPNSNVSIEAGLVESNSWSAFIVGKVGPLASTRPFASLKADRVVGIRHIAVDCDTADQVVHAREIISYYNHAVWCMTTPGVATTTVANQLVYADNIILDNPAGAGGGGGSASGVTARVTGSNIETHGNITVNTGQCVIAYDPAVKMKICDGVVRNTWIDATAYPIYTQPYSGTNANVSLRNVALISDAGVASIMSDVAGCSVLVYGRVAANTAASANVTLVPAASVDVIAATTKMI